MKRIYELDPHVADLIAAGEVVERPASAVKELMENSIDAGARNIAVEITAGGMTYIRVTDDGCGMSADDAMTAFLPHATSKLRGAEGLEAIATLGFRGEALAAIAAVSRIEMLTRERDSEEGTRLRIEAGAILSVSPAGCPIGTTIIVRDLFFNTPARMKFMKTDRAESGSIASAALRCALSRPEVSVRLARDGRTEFQTPGDGRADSCIYSLFGREFSAGLLKAEASDEAVAVAGFVTSPAAARGNRSYQYFFVNGRPIRSSTLQAALERAYANLIPSGRFPSCALYITTGFGSVDVNVHPAKTEVKFVSDKQVFDGVYYAALGALDASGLRGAAESHEPPAAYKKTGGFESMQVEEYRRKYADGSGDRRQSGEERLAGEERQTHEERQTREERQSRDAGDLGGKPNVNAGGAGDPQLSMFNRAADTGTRGNEQGLPTYQPEREAPRTIGEAFGTYIIAEHGESLWLIDKHAAHERIHFNALKSGGTEQMPQSLITPIAIRCGYEEASLLLDNLPLLEELGFEVESFGEDSVAVRGIPSGVEIDDAEAVISGICKSLSHGGAASPEHLDDIYRAIACKASIKAGDAAEAGEIRALAERVLSGEITHCPHGRPVAMEITRASMEKHMGRR